MGGNKAVDPSVGNQAIQGTNLALQAAILAVSILLAMTCGWCLRSCLPRGTNTLREVLQRAAESEEERERRKQFVDANLESFEWCGEEEAAIEKKNRLSSKKKKQQQKSERDNDQGQDTGTAVEDNNHNDTEIAEHGSDHSNSSGSSSDDGIHDEEQDCPVCLGPLEKGDTVSASNNDKCPHVYHTECVHMWLLRNLECPMCRHVFLIQPSEEGEGEEQSTSAAEEGGATNQQQSAQQRNMNPVVYESEEVLA